MGRISQRFDFKEFEPQSAWMIKFPLRSRQVEGVGIVHASEAGGLSGRPLFSPSTEVLRELARALKGKLPLIGVGGILSGADAKAKINAGASLVQIYTGFIYRGPDLIRDAVKAIAGN